jgi:hypothetical protein
LSDLAMGQKLYPGYTQANFDDGKNLYNSKCAACHSTITPSSTPSISISTTPGLTVTPTPSLTPTPSTSTRPNTVFMKFDII